MKLLSKKLKSIVPLLTGVLFTAGCTLDGASPETTVAPKTNAMKPAGPVGNTTPRSAY